MKKIINILLLITLWSCQTEKKIKPDYFLTADQKHNKFSKLIPPVLKVKSGSIIKAETHEASDQQFHSKANLDDLKNLSFDPIHPMTGPVFVEEAKVGDILAVDLLEIEVHDYGWQAIVSGFGFLADRFPNPKLNIHKIDKRNNTTTMFNDKVRIPLNLFLVLWVLRLILRKCFQQSHQELMVVIWMTRVWLLELPFIFRYSLMVLYFLLAMGMQSKDLEKYVVQLLKLL